MTDELLSTCEELCEAVNRANAAYRAALAELHIPPTGDLYKLTVDKERWDQLTAAAVSDFESFKKLALAPCPFPAQ